MSDTSNLHFNHLPTAYGPTFQLADRSYLFFGGTGYLNLNNHTSFRALYKEGIDRYGVNIGTSRNNNVLIDVYQKAEEEASLRFGHEAALMASSGFLAAQLAVRYLANTASEMIYAPDSHPALWLDQAPENAHSFSAWAQQTVAYINARDQKDFVIVSNTINSLKPEQYTFEAFEQIETGKRLHFLLDDSHGIGVLSPTGALPYCRVPHRKEWKITVIASMAKGLGLDAGVVLSDQNTIRAMKQTPMFLGASPPAPAAMYTFIQAKDIFKEQYEKLQEILVLGNELLSSQSVSIPFFPVYYIDIPNLFQKLKNKNIIISSFSYPRPTDPPISRIVLTSGHEREDLFTLHQALSI